MSSPVAIAGLQKPVASDLTPMLARRLAAHLKGVSGVCIEVDKSYLLESKLRPIMQREGIAGFADLLNMIEANRNSRIADQVVQAMTINETHFFRDRIPFDTLRDSLPSLALRRVQDRSLRVWSAACSTGQELYSVAMLIEEQQRLFSGWRVDLVGTDISDAVVAKAKKGNYTQFEVQRGLPVPFLLKYFERQRDEWQVVEQLRRNVTFKQVNLLANFSDLGRFDIIFCRNVLFYFEPAERIRVLTRMGQLLRPDGYLVLGSSEAMTALSAGFRPSAPGSCFYVTSEIGAAATVRQKASG